jgi:uncharacterized protein
LKVVVDTSVLVAALCSPHGAPHTIYQLWQRRKFTLVLSQWQLAEIGRVLRYPRISKRYGITKPEVGSLINRLRQRAHFVTLPALLDISPDPDDNPILTTCLVGDADFLVSIDKEHILIFKKIGRTKVLTPHDFLKQLGVRPK